MDDPPLLLFHASSTVNRPSIAAYGLDVSRMSRAGIAGSPEPQAEGVFLAETLWEGFWYASFGRHERVDIWQARVTDLRLHEVNEGWVCEEVITPDRLTLVEADLSPRDAESRIGREQRGNAGGSSLTGGMSVTFRADSSDDPPAS